MAAIGSDVHRTGARFVSLGLVAFVTVAIGCLVSGTPAGGRWWLLWVLLLLAGTAWAMALVVRPQSTPAALACYVVFGVAGSAVDLVQPAGPAFVLGYMALAGMGLALPRGAALGGGVVVLVALGAAEAITSDHPTAAILAVALGAAFLFLAGRFAAMSRQAERRSVELLQRVEAERAAREEAAALAERARLARELHDVLAHALSGLTLQLEATRLYATRSGADPQLVDQVTLAHGLARQGMTTAKQAIAALRGSARLDIGQLPGLVADFRRVTGIVATLSVSGTPVALGPVQQEAGYRMVQEALSNVAKHRPDASHVVVRVEWIGAGVRITVSDTGEGGDLAPARTTHPAPLAGAAAAVGFGLAGIAERAAAIGGSVTFGPTQDGFEVIWQVEG